MWTGESAKKLGLIDDFGSAGYVAREVIKTKHIINYTQKPNYLERLTKRLGMAMADHFALSMGLSKVPVVSKV